MLKLSQLKQKEMILIYQGKRLGYIHDVNIDVDTGKIKQLFIHKHGEKTAFFQRVEEVEISWEQLITIGVDIILVSEHHHSQKKLPE